MRIDKNECLHTFYTGKFMVSHLLPYFAKNLLYYFYEKDLNSKSKELRDKIQKGDLEEIIQYISSLSKEREALENIKFTQDKDLERSAYVLSRFLLREDRNELSFRGFRNTEIIKMIYELVATQHNEMRDIVPIVEKIVNILLEYSKEDTSFDYLYLLQKFNSISEFQKYYYHCPPNQYVADYQIFNRMYGRLSRLEFSENNLEDFIEDAIKTEPSFFGVIETVFLTLLNRHYLEKFNQAISSQDKELFAKEFKSFYQFVYGSLVYRSERSVQLFILGRRNADGSIRKKIDELSYKFMTDQPRNTSNTAILDMLQILLEFEGKVNHPNAIFNLIESDDPLSKQN